MVDIAGLKMRFGTIVMLSSLCNYTQYCLLLCLIYLSFSLYNWLNLVIRPNLSILFIFFLLYINKCRISYLFLIAIGLLADALYGFFWGYTSLTYLTAMLVIQLKHRWVFSSHFSVVFITFTLVVLVCAIITEVSNILHLDTRTSFIILDHLMLIALYPAAHYMLARFSSYYIAKPL
jgi:rod shape-determining protein MreD